MTTYKTIKPESKETKQVSLIILCRTSSRLLAQNPLQNNSPSPPNIPAAPSS